MEFDDLAEGELAMPGDPDEEESSRQSGDANDVNRGRRAESISDSVVLDISADEESVGSNDSETPAPAGRSGESPGGRSRRRTPSDDPQEFSQTPLPPPPPHNFLVEGGDLSQILVSNLPSVPGHEVELLGIVTHHFCRRGGGDRVRARKRVRSFGTRYRRGLDELGRQAMALGADTVLGVEVTMQTTGPADEPIIWVLMQGTAAKRR